MNLSSLRQAASQALSRVAATPAERVALEATNSDKCSPHGAALKQLAAFSETSEERGQVMAVVWRRMAEKPEQWRCVYKALKVVEYLAKNGSDACVSELSAACHRLEGLTRFAFLDLDGTDQGVNVRQCSSVVVALLRDRALLEEERTKAKANRAKYTGVSAAEMRSTVFTGAVGSVPPAPPSDDDDDDFRISEPGSTSGASFARPEEAPSVPKFRVTLSSAPRPVAPLPPKLAFALPPPGGLKPPPRPAPPAAPSLDLFAQPAAPPPAGPPASDMLTFFDTQPAASGNPAVFDPFALATPPVTMQLPPLVASDPFAALPSLADAQHIAPRWPDMLARTASGGVMGASAPVRPITLEDKLNDSLASLLR